MNSVRSVRRDSGLLILALALVVVRSDAADSTEFPYNKYFQRLALAREADPERHARIVHCVEPTNKQDELPKDIALEIRDRANRIAIPLDADHCFELPIDATWSEHNAMLSFNTSIKIGLGTGIVGRLPTSTHLDYTTLMESIPAYESIKARQGFLLRMFMPSPKGLLLTFGDAHSEAVVVHAIQGDQSFRADAHGVLHMPYTPTLNGSEVDISALPTIVAPDLQ